MSRKGRQEPGDSPDASLPWWRRPGRGAVLSLLSLVVLSVFAISGLERLRARVVSLPEYNQAPRLTLMDVPAWVDREKWRPQILESVQVPEQVNLLSGGLVQQIGRQLSSGGWVSQVKQVSQEVDGTVKAWCVYRRPVAMIRIREPGSREPLFVAVDKDGVRLPQKYRNVKNAGWIQILGVADRSDEVPLPEVGQAFTADDAVAAVKIANILFAQDFAPRIVAVDVTNFRGRQDRYRGHIVVQALNADNQVFPFPWGSAPGEEIEENTWLEKVRLISAQINKGGSHVQAADVSIFPNRIIERVQPAISTADGSLPRDQ